MQPTQSDQADLLPQASLVEGSQLGAIGLANQRL